VTGGRFLLGIGGGWNREEIESHGTAFTSRMQKMREQVAAMKEIWTKDTAGYNGQIVKFPSMPTWPKPAQKPHPPILLGGAFPRAARRAVRYGDGWYPNATAGAPEDLAKLEQFRDLGGSPGECEPAGRARRQDPSHARPLGKAETPAQKLT